MQKPGWKSLLFAALVALALLAAVVLLVKSSRETEKVSLPPKAAKPKADEPVAPTLSISTDSALAPFDESAITSAVEQAMETLGEQRIERIRKAIEELEDKLYVRRNDSAGQQQIVGHKVSPEEQARLIEEFLKKFPLSWETHGVGMHLALTYNRMKRYDDAEQVYRDIVASLPDDFFTRKQETLQTLANLEIETGDLAGAEKTLLEIMKTAPPRGYDQSDGGMEQNSKLWAPLLLADVYRKAGRTDDAEILLKQVDEYAFSLPRGYWLYDNMAYYTWRVCRARIELLFGRTPLDRLDEAMKSAEALIQDYSKKLEGRGWRSPEHTERNIRGYMDILYENAAIMACRMRVDALFEKISPTAADNALTAAETVIDELGKSLEAHQWNDPDSAKREVERLPANMREYAERLAAEKKDATKSR